MIIKRNTNLPEIETTNPEVMKNEPVLEILENIEKNDDEMVQELVDKINQDVPNQLLSRLKQSDPSFFETSVNELIQKIYGLEAKLERTHGGSDDGGIDGIVNIPLGFKIYIQAKRYKETKMITPNDLKHFVGSLASEHAANGVFITSSDFHRDVKKYIELLNNQPSIKLINGNQLVEMMIFNDIGVKSTRHEVRKVDDEYFSSSK